jgi:hypothetical protein
MERHESLLLQNKFSREDTNWLRVSESLLFNAKSAIFHLYHSQNKLYFMTWWWCPLCTRPKHSLIFMVLTHWNSRDSCRSIWTHYSDSRPSSLCLLSGEATKLTSDHKPYTTDVGLYQDSRTCIKRSPLEQNKVAL